MSLLSDKPFTDCPAAPGQEGNIVMPDEDESVHQLEAAIRGRLHAVAGKVRHPGLALSHFVAGPDDLAGYDYGDKDDHHDDEDACGGEDDLRVLSGKQEAAMLRRAALLVAALDIVDQCMDDLQLLCFEDGFPDAEDAEDTFVYQVFPERHRHAYDEAFFRKILVTAVGVAGDLADPNAGELARSLAQEAAAVASAMRIALPFNDPWSYVRSIAEQTAGLQNSMLADLAQGTKTENDHINGAVVAAGRRAAVPTPYNDTMFRLIRAREAVAAPEK